MMQLFGITGWKNSGKTTLVVKLVEILRGRGYSVSTLKHAHHNFDIDLPGTDSYKHRQAGAGEVAIVSANRWAIMHELSDEAEPDMQAMLAKMTPVDLILVEGFKRHNHPKLQAIRTANNTQPLPTSSHNLVALAADAEICAADYACDGPVFNLDEPETIADFIVAHCQLRLLP